MHSLILSLPWYVSGVIVVGFFILLSMIGLWATRKFITSKNQKSIHDIAGYTFGIIGVIYAVLLGFVAVNVNEDYHDAEKISEQEAILLIDLFRDAAVFDPEMTNTIRNAIIDYTRYVIDEEWNIFASKEFSSQPQIMHNLWRAYTDIQPSTDSQKIWLAESVRKLNEFSNIRLERIYNSKGSIGEMMWTFLLAGAIVVTSFMYFFYTENMLAQSLMTAFLAGTIAFMLFLVFQLDNIYYGDVSVKPTYLKKALHFFEKGGDLN